VSYHSWLPLKVLLKNDIGRVILVVNNVESSDEDGSQEMIFQ
jgi:hypothetical protein